VGGVELVGYVCFGAGDGYDAVWRYVERKGEGDIPVQPWASSP
jgi:hypothetical protein